ncbi:MAG: 50S ribosomal protein L6 [Armatimonadetes bacterium]|nr:50S ribosomal protein L6 [Armatimonadota bacterium]
MSRIGQLPIQVPNGVQISQADGQLTVKGPKGTLSRRLLAEISIKVEDGKIICQRPSDARPHRAKHGLVRSLVNNMVVGVTEGYEKRLQIIGVGYRAELQGKNLVLSVGYSQPATVEPMEGISFEVGQETNTRIPFVIVRGIDKEVLGQQAAEIRAIRPPEPYKYVVSQGMHGKGIRYHGEVVRKKVGKTGAAGK